MRILTTGRLVNFIMTNTIQQNVSTVIFATSAKISEIKRVSQDNEKLLHTLLDSLNILSDELTKLDSLVDRKLMKK